MYEGVIKMKKTLYIRPLFKIAVPIMLSNIISQVQMLIDRAFLGHMDKLYMSALSNVTAPVWTTMSFCFSLTIGASIIISQNVGANRKDQIEEYAAALIKWSNVLPVLLFFFWEFFAMTVFRLMGASQRMLPMCREYITYFAPVFLIVGLEASGMVIMQTSNYTKPMIWFGILRAGLNVFLDWVLIFGKLGLPQMGIKGAAIATLIAEYLGFGYALLVFMTSKELFTRPSVKQILKAKVVPFLLSVKLGLNAGLEDFAWSFGNLMLIRILNTINEMAAGIYSIIFSVELLAVVIVGALGQGTLTLSSEAYGRKDVKQYKGVCITAYSLCVALALFVLILCLAFPKQIISIFTPDASVIAVCGGYLIFMCINLYGKFGNIIVGSSIRGSGNTIWMLMTQIFGTVLVVSLALLFVKAAGLGIVGVLLAVISDELIRALINLRKYISIIKKMQNKQE